MTADTLLVTLSRHFGTLTPGWVLTLMDTKLIPAPSLPASTTMARSEFDSTMKTFASKSRDRCSTAPSVSAEVYLRVVSRGTSYSRPRLAFHPYAQVIQKICTSLLVRSSTSLWGGFNLPAHRSTGFGSPTNDSTRAHVAPRKLRAVGFPMASGMIPLTSPLVRTPWPVIQNG